MNRRFSVHRNNIFGPLQSLRSSTKFTWPGTQHLSRQHNIFHYNTTSFTTRSSVRTLNARRSLLQHHKQRSVNLPCCNMFSINVSTCANSLFRPSLSPDVPSVLCLDHRRKTPNRPNPDAIRKGLSAALSAASGKRILVVHIHEPIADVVQDMLFVWKTPVVDPRYVSVRAGYLSLSPQANSAKGRADTERSEQDAELGNVVVWRNAACEKVVDGGWANCYTKEMFRLEFSNCSWFSQ